MTLRKFLNINGNENHSYLYQQLKVIFIFMSFICESGIGHVAGSAVETLITITCNKIRPKNSFSGTLGYVVHEFMVEPAVDLKICHNVSIIEIIKTVFDYNKMYNAISDNFSDTLSSVHSIISIANFATIPLMTGFIARPLTIALAPFADKFAVLHAAVYFVTSFTIPYIINPIFTHIHDKVDETLSDYFAIHTECTEISTFEDCSKLNLPYFEIAKGLIALELLGVITLSFVYPASLQLSAIAKSNSAVLLGIKAFETISKTSTDYDANIKLYSDLCFDVTYFSLVVSIFGTAEIFLPLVYIPLNYIGYSPISSAKELVATSVKGALDYTILVTTSAKDTAYYIYDYITDVDQNDIEYDVLMNDSLSSE